MKRLVVIGNGMSGARFIEEVLRRGGRDRFEITLFGDEPRGNYNRVLLSEVLSGAKSAHDITLHPLEWYRENGITFHAGVRAKRIDRENRIVHGRGGVTAEYDILVLATGSRAFVPPMEGLKTPEGGPKTGIFVMRTIEDCDRIASYACKAGRAVVIGGGLLGLEAARGLMEYGAQVDVVHRAPHLMNAQLDTEGGRMLKVAVEKMGIRVHLNKETARVDGDEAVTGLTFKDGEKLACDMVVIATGIQPNVELAKECGLRVERGVVVDDQLRCAGEENIYAVGEIAQHRGLVYGVVAPLWEQGRVLADVLTGKNLNAAYTGSRVATKLKVMGLDLTAMGDPEARDGDEVIQYVESRRGRYKKLIIRDGKLAGVILLGETTAAASLMQAFDRGMALPDERESLLFKIGKAAALSATALADDAPVCQCNAVSAGCIRACIAAGAKDLPAVMQGTRAGTGCGSCKVLVRQLLG